MRGGHGRKRARTSDRDRVVEAITLAYVDGQIDADDRDERVARALTSTTIDGLRPLVADLQVPGHLGLPEPQGATAVPVEPRTGASRSWGQSRRRFMQSSRTEKAIVLTAVVGLPLALLVAVAAGASDPEPNHPDLHSEAGIEQLVDAVEEEFGTTRVLEVEINDTWARVYVPIEGESRYRHYTYGSSIEPEEEIGFHDTGQGGTTDDADPDLVDLADLDAASLVANLEKAHDELGVDGDVDVMVTIADERMATAYSTTEPFVDEDEDAPAHVEIELVNEFMERGSLTTDLEGDRVLHRVRGS